MNILISVNNAYYDAARIMLQSLFRNNINCNIVIYLFYTKLVNKQITELRSLIEKNHGILHVIKINDSMLEKVPLGSLSKETYYRLYAPLLLPSDLDRILYLDIDMIITGSIREMYESNFDNSFFMAVPDTSLGIEKIKKILRMKNSDIYVNAGVLLMNLDSLRKEFDMESMIGYAVKHPDKVPNCDQELINKFYHERIGHLNWIYNYEARFHSVLEILLYPINKKNLLKKVRIIHYMGKKPWKPGFDGKFLREYYRYAGHTSYADEVRKNMQRRLMNIIKLLCQISIRWMKGKIIGDF